MGSQSYILVWGNQCGMILYLYFTISFWEAKPKPGTESIGDPKDLLLSDNGTLFVSDHASQLGRCGSPQDLDAELLNLSLFMVICLFSTINKTNKNHH